MDEVRSLQGRPQAYGSCIIFIKGDNVSNTNTLALPEAESYLNKIAAEAEMEALANARFPERLIALVHHTRALSRN